MHHRGQIQLAKVKRSDQEQTGLLLRRPQQARTFGRVQFNNILNGIRVAPKVSDK